MISVVVDVNNLGAIGKKIANFQIGQPQSSVDRAADCPIAQSDLSKGKIAACNSHRSFCFHHAHSCHHTAVPLLQCLVALEAIDSLGKIGLGNVDVDPFAFIIKLNQDIAPLHFLSAFKHDLFDLPGDFGNQRHTFLLQRPSRSR